MATNVTQDSATAIQIIAGGTYTAGTPVRIGSFFGVPQSSVVSGDPVTMQIRGVCKLVKVASVAAFAVGDKVYWDGTTCTAVSSDYFIGVCTATATSGATVLYVDLNGAIGSPIYGTLTVASGATTGTASVGTAYNGKAVAATLQVDGANTGKFVQKAVVASGTLTVTISGDPGAGGATVNYAIFQ